MDVKRVTFSISKLRISKEVKALQLLNIVIISVTLAVLNLLKSSEEFKSSEMIKGWKVIFRPDPQLKSEIRKEIKLKRISSEWMK